MSNARTAMTRGCEMAHPLHHAESSARKFGGVPSDYQAVHDWFDASKEHLALFTHRAMRHHAQGLFEAERVFGLTLTNSAGRDIPVRWIGEQHIREDCQGRIPSMADWLRRIQPEPWMAQWPHRPACRLRALRRPKGCLGLRGRRRKNGSWPEGLDGGARDASHARCLTALDRLPNE